MPPEEIQLNNTQLESLADLITARMTAGASAAQEDEAPKVKQSKSVAPTAEEIGAAVLAQIKQNSNADNKKVFDVMWKDKLNNAVSSVPGLNEFIEGEDDYGNIRSEKLNAIEDYDSRLNALSKLTNSFKEASAGQGNRRPIVNKAAQQKAEESESAYDELKQKQMSGGYTSAQEMANDFFGAMSKEADGLM